MIAEGLADAGCEPGLAAPWGGAGPQERDVARSSGSLGAASPRHSAQAENSTAYRPAGIEVPPCEHLSDCVDQVGRGGERNEQDLL